MDIEHGNIRADQGRSADDVVIELTSSSLIHIDYVAPPDGLGSFITTLYHFRCEERDFRDVQPASIGHLALFPFGKGAALFASGQRDPNPEIAILTPTAAAAALVVEGPFHAFGAALTPLGWAALTGLNAGQHGDRLLPARDILGSEVEVFCRPLLEEYRSGSRTGRECALAVADFIGGVLKPVNPQHVAFIRSVNLWLGSAFNPRIEDLLDRTAYSARQVQRLTERYFGLPPQALARKYRALRAAALLSLPTLTPEFEAELGEAFFDQPHMIREIKQFVGRTPARLRQGDQPYLSEMISLQNLRELER